VHGWGEVMPKLMQFDNDETLALQALGFEVTHSSGISCAIYRRGDCEDELSVMIVRIEGQANFSLIISMHKDSSGDAGLTGFVTREAILKAVQQAAVEEDNEAAKLAISKPHGTS
jgi:hypothetical protein